MGLMSPRPNALSTPGAGEGWLKMGMTVRVTIFQSSLSENGMTGWTLRSHCVTSLGPMPKLKLFWNGTLIMLAIGFCAALANASVSSANAAPETPNRPAATITSVSVPCTSILPNESRRRLGRFTVCSLRSPDSLNKAAGAGARSRTPAQSRPIH